jgi:DNA-directed RNA polymerase subunit RPC12/RpoP
MDLERLTCSSCGAALQVPEGVELVNCRHCGSSLTVHRTESVVFTELLQSVKQQADRLEQTTALLQIQNEMAQLDRDWERKSAALMVRGKHGHTFRPNKAAAIFMGVFGAGFGIFWTSMAATSGAPSFFVGFGMLFIGVVIVSSILIFVKSIQYNELQKNYEERRRQLMLRLVSAGQE